MRYLGLNLRKKRNLARLTQEKLAKKIGISRQTLNAIEAGRSIPSLKLAEKLADFFQVELNNLIKRKEEKMKRRDDWFSWLPFDEVASLHNSIDHLFGESFVNSRGVRFSQPRVNMYEKDKNLVVDVELPGFSEKDVNIELSEDTIKVEGEKKGEIEVKSENYYRKESRLGNFSRILSFPYSVDPNKAKATFKNGKLTVIIPKSSKANTKVIKIKPE